MPGHGGSEKTGFVLVNVTAVVACTKKATLYLIQGCHVWIPNRAIFHERGRSANAIKIPKALASEKGLRWFKELTPNVLYNIPDPIEPVSGQEPDPSLVHNPLGEKTDDA